MNKKMMALIGGVALVLGGATAAGAADNGEDSRLDYPVTHRNHIDSTEFGVNSDNYLTIKVFCHGPDLVYVIPNPYGSGISVLPNQDRCRG